MSDRQWLKWIKAVKLKTYLFAPPPVNSGAVLQRKTEICEFIRITDGIVCVKHAQVFDYRIDRRPDPELERAATYNQGPMREPV